MDFLCGLACGFAYVNPYVDSLMWTRQSQPCRIRTRQSRPCRMWIRLCGHVSGVVFFYQTRIPQMVPYVDFPKISLLVDTPFAKNLVVVGQ